jgi:3-phosphoshikimate 1-carboxyvinyltransferase
MALFGAMAEGETRIENFSSARDCASTLSCLRALGVDVALEGRTVVVGGRGVEAWTAPSLPLDAENSGSTLRMLAGILAGRPFPSVLTGDASLRKRPVERVAAPLRAMGAEVRSEGGLPPLEIRGGSLRAIDWKLEVASAQAKTAVLLAGLQASGTTSVSEPAPSRDHTEALLPHFGATVRVLGNRVSVEGGARLRGRSYRVPGDVSSAAFLVVAALILPDSEVRIDDVLLGPRRAAFLDVLREMGAAIETRIVEESPEPRGTIRARSSRLSGTTVEGDLVPSLIDEVPALAVAACHAQGTFRISGAGELRVKESDRIGSLALGLSRLGARVHEAQDGFTIHGGRPLRGARVASSGDHRIAMALAVAGLVAEGETEIEGSDAISVSFPEFPELLARGVGAKT